MVDIAALLNAAAAKLKINPSAIQEGTPASAIWGSRFNDDPNAKFEAITQDDRATFLGSAIWFNVNFTDVRAFPAFKITLRTKQGLEGAIDSLTTSLYEAQGNLLSVRHGELTQCPRAKPGKPEAAAIYARIYSAPDSFPINENSTSFELSSSRQVAQACGLVSPAVLKKILAASKIEWSDDKPLTYAMVNKKWANMEVLIDSGVDIHGDGEDRSPLMDAVQLGLEEAVHILVKAGANLDQTDYEGWTALSISVEATLHADMAKAQRITQYLWDHGARKM